MSAMTAEQAEQLHAAIKGLRDHVACAHCTQLLQEIERLQHILIRLIEQDKR